MVRCVRLESSGKILEANWGKMILSRKYSSFLMQVIDRCYLNGAVDYKESRVLYILEFLNQG